MGWQSAIHNPQEIQVFQALSDPLWEFRTVSGIAKETGLPSATVERIIAAHGDLIGESEVPDAKGRPLYYLKSRQTPIRQFLSRLRKYLTNSACS
jgi:hypothetical protein